MECPKTKNYKSLIMLFKSFFILLLVFFSACSTRFTKNEIHYDKRISYTNNIYQQVASKYNINYKTMHAICFTESSEREFVINVNNGPYRGHYNFKSKYAALRFIQKIKNYSFDTGLCQINNQWLDKFNLEHIDLLNKYINLEVATIIYKKNVQACNNNIVCALSMYNTGKKHHKNL